MSHVTRKPVFRVCDQIWLKLACSETRVRATDRHCRQMRRKIIFGTKKHDLAKTSGKKKNSPHKKIAIEISPINKLQCTVYLSNSDLNPLIYLPVLFTVSYMYL